MKRFTTTLMVICIIMTLATPVFALEYDWRNPPFRPLVSGDTDPWNEFDVQEPPPPENGLITIITLYIITKYYFILPPTIDDLDKEKVTLESRDRRINKKTSDRQIIY